MAKGWVVVEDNIISGSFGVAKSDANKDEPWTQRNSYLVEMMDEYCNVLQTIVVSEDEGATDKIRELNDQGYYVMKIASLTGDESQCD